MTYWRPTLTTLAPLCLGLVTLPYKGPAHEWARTHAGDALVVLFLVGLLGLVSSWSIGRRILYVAVFSFGIEFAQLFAGASERGNLLQLIIGSQFDVLDFVYYSVGLVLAAALDRLASRSVPQSTWESS